MAFTVPSAPAQRTLYNDAKRVRDELGKGQEILRVAKANIGPVANATTVREVVLIPDVDIVLVSIRLIGEGADADDLIELYAPANGENFDTAAGATNRLIAQVLGSTTADDTLVSPALLGLNGNVVQAGQPIIASVQEVSSDTTPLVFFQISYILADEATSYAAA